MRKVFLEDLPRWEKGFPVKEGTINWRKSINYNIKFIYDNIKGKIKINDYDGKYLYIKYLDKDIFKITTGSFRSCLFGELLKEELYSYSYDKNKKRQVDLRNLPIKYSGIDWKKVKESGIQIPFKYNDIIGKVSIVDYDGRYIFIKYLNNEPFKILIPDFKRCSLGNLLGEKTNKYKYNINDIIETKLSKLKILKQIRIKNSNNKNTHKGYEYQCLKCGNIDVITEGHLKEGKGCNVCCNAPRKVLKGVNDMWTINPKLASLLVNPEDGYKYMQNSNKKVDFKCPNCGNIIKNKKISNIKNEGLSCPRCSDGKSYSEKFIYNLLKQLNINFKIELSKNNFNWCNNYRYDFYFKFNNEQYIIEVNGLQHYKETTRGRSLFEEQENDKLKKELAIANEVKEENYIVIDCRESDLEYIKNNILHSRLNGIFELSKIDWLQCHEFACNSFVKMACNLWNNEIHNTEQIAKEMKLCRNTIINYLKKGAELNWTNYNPKEEQNKAKKSDGVPIGIYKNNILLGKFKNARKLVEQLNEIFDVRLSYSTILNVRNGNVNEYKGFTFKSLNEKIKNNIIINKNEIEKGLKLQNATKPIKVYKNNIFLGMFPSPVKLENISKKIFNVQFNNASIYRICNKKRKTHIGFTFEYASKEEYEKYIENKIYKRDKEDKEDIEKINNNSIKVS